MSRVIAASGQPVVVCRSLLSCRSLFESTLLEGRGGGGWGGGWLKMLAALIFSGVNAIDTRFFVLVH